MRTLFVRAALVAASAYLLSGCTVSQSEADHFTRGTWRSSVSHLVTTSAIRNQWLPLIRDQLNDSKYQSNLIQQYYVYFQSARQRKKEKKRGQPDVFAWDAVPKDEGADREWVSDLISWASGGPEPPGLELLVSGLLVCSGGSATSKVAVRDHSATVTAGEFHDSSIDSRFDTFFMFRVRGSVRVSTSLPVEMPLEVYTDDGKVFDFGLTLKIDSVSEGPPPKSRGFILRNGKRLSKYEAIKISD